MESVQKCAIKYFWKLSTTFGIRCGRRFFFFFLIIYKLFKIRKNCLKSNKRWEKGGWNVKPLPNAIIRTNNNNNNNNYYYYYYNDDDDKWMWIIKFIFYFNIFSILFKENGK